MIEKNGNMTILWRQAREGIYEHTKKWWWWGNHKTRLTELKAVASGELNDCHEKEELRGYRVIANVLEIIIFYFIIIFLMGASSVAQWQRICLQCRIFRKHGFEPWVGKTPWRRKWHPAPVFLPEESHGQKSLEGYSPLVIFFNLSCDCTTWHAGSYFSKQGSNPCPLLWKHGILTIWSPGKSLEIHIFWNLFACVGNIDKYFKKHKIGAQSLSSHRLTTFLGFFFFHFFPLRFFSFCHGELAILPDQSHS